MTGHMNITNRQAKDSASWHKGIGARLGFGFAIVVVLTMVLGIVAIVGMNSLADVTIKMHDHPLAVSNAVRDIRVNIMAMHRSMKDVVLAKNTEQLEEAEGHVADYEQDVFVAFKMVFERFLGEKHDVEVAHRAFCDWKPIREEVIELMHQNRRDEASEITKGKGAGHVAYMDESIQTMSDFASKKAASFFDNAQDSRQRHLTLVSVLFLMVSGACVLMGILITRSITKPLTYIMDGISKLGDGNLDHTLNMERDDELGKLSAAFDKMTRDLKKTTASRNELDGANQQLNAINQQLQVNITAREQSEEQLQESEKRFKRAVVDSPFPIMIHAEDGEVIQLSKTWSELTGYQPEDIPTISDWAEKAYGQRMDLIRDYIDELYELDEKASAK